jgi:16S rRNA (uracil1498-N3)-methyltransferase
VRIPRIYQNRPLQLHDSITLDKETGHRLISVLRIEKNNEIILFNGDGKEYLGIIIDLKRESIQVKITEVSEKNWESPLKIHLGQVISKGEKMDFVVQKATELGVNVITPLFSERCVVHFKKERLQKKQEHWQKIVIHAAEQCGRTLVPLIEKPISLLEWISARTEHTRLTLALTTKNPFKEVKIQESIALMIGPEGGLTTEEVEYAQHHGFTSTTLGPRILRTETAAIVALSAIQLKAGDL